MGNQNNDNSGAERLWKPGEVAKAFGVDTKTVGRWAAAGKLHPISTPGGQRRYLDAEIRSYLDGTR